MAQMPSSYMLPPLSLASHRSSSRTAKISPNDLQSPGMRRMQFDPLNLKRRAFSLVAGRSCSSDGVKDTQQMRPCSHSAGFASRSPIRPDPLSMALVGQAGACEVPAAPVAPRPPKGPKTGAARPEFGANAPRTAVPAVGSMAKVEIAPPSISTCSSLQCLSGDVEDEDLGDLGGPRPVLEEPGEAVAIPKLSNLVVRRPRVLPPMSLTRKVRWPDPAPVRLLAT